MQFIDEAKVSVRSGNGGPGSVSFRREAKIPRGGRGGHIILRANPQLHSLLDFRFKKSYFAENGGRGANKKMTGADGENLLIEVPLGTLIKDQDGKVLLDVDTEQELILLKGGRGGKGNWFFKNSVNQAPTHAQPGEPGEGLELNLELKLLADVGLVGKPNAGKSTLISVLSAARPKIADYPFTTLMPNLGVVQFKDEKSFVIADIPGIIKGAHKGVGLGHQFLRHIERTKIFLIVIDASSFSGNDPFADYLEIQEELNEYEKMNHDKEGFIPFSERQQLVVLNKSDLLTDEQRQDVISQFSAKAINCTFISAATKNNLQSLVDKLGEVIFAD